MRAAGDQQAIYRYVPQAALQPACSGLAIFESASAVAIGHQREKIRTRCHSRHAISHKISEIGVSRLGGQVHAHIDG